MNVAHQLCVDVALPLLRIRDTSFATLGFSATLRTRISLRRREARNHEVQKRKRYDGLHLTEIDGRATSCDERLQCDTDPYGRRLHSGKCSLRYAQPKVSSLSFSLFFQPRVAILVPMSNSVERVRPIQATISSIFASRPQVPSSYTRRRSTTAFQVP